MISSFIYCNTVVKCKSYFGGFCCPYRSKCIIIHSACATPGTFFMNSFHSKYLSHSYEYKKIYSEKFQKPTALYYKPSMMIIIIELLFCVIRHVTSLKICLFFFVNSFLGCTLKLTTVEILKKLFD